MHVNDNLRFGNGTDNYHKYIVGMVLSDGAKAMADKYGLFWYMDAICSYQIHKKFQDQPFQVWTLERKQHEFTAIVKATDGNDNVLVTQHIEFTDFEGTLATIWIEGNVLLLPSEH